jgi:hypothetical protein
MSNDDILYWNDKNFVIDIDRGAEGGMVVIPLENLTEFQINTIKKFYNFYNPDEKHDYDD